MNLRGLTTAALTIMTIVATVTVAGPVRASEKAPQYVALGDSYASGVGSGGPFSGASCLRSPTGYPPQLASAIKAAKFGFVACSGAKIKEVNSTQLTVLNRSTTLVTVTAGGNDLGFSAGIAACAQGTDADCQAVVTAAQQFSRSVLPSLLDDLYRHIKSLAPRAEIVVTGYPRFFELTANCTEEPFSLSKRAALNSAVDVLDQEVQRRVLAAHATFVDVRAAFAGHGLCSSTTWINGLNSSAPFHPNSDGYRNGYLPALLRATACVR
ncbi:SGNH/GDSL hydrolase family protein [Micromonospora sp. CA-240977]|uniref:SGNH/GDSL hydrolase family protein n=1 Tax=Micromonospora sp. CA-240977 TaxID=3239957 RepID=UPI003D9166FD